MRKGVSGVFQDDTYFDLQQQLEANVSKFAAYKAYHATQQIQSQKADRNGEERSDEDYKKNAKAVFDAFNRYQVAEYNTAVARSRTAKQWIDFNADPISNELYPNLKWIPSRSTEPREEHRKFWGLVLPKNHPFWQTNQPGNLWNCKCDWEESDEPSHSGEVPTGRAAKGLEGNPGETGEIFTDKAAYFQAAKPEIEKLAYKTARNESLRVTATRLKGKIIEKQNAGEPLKIGFNRKGLEHLQHDYFPDRWIRDAILRKIDSVLEAADYAGEADFSKENPMVDKFYYYKTVLLKKDWYLNVRKLKNGEAYLYSMTDKIKKE